jgi:hypothetical protein
MQNKEDRKGDGRYIYGFENESGWAKKKLTAVLGKDGFGSQDIRIVSSKNTNMGILICIHF